MPKKKKKKYESLSGMKINYQKTTVYRLGSIRNTDAKFYSTRKIAWSSGSVENLGIKMSIDSQAQETLKLNYDVLIEKVKNVLTVWHNRSLSLFGKILVVNTLISSIFIYRMTLLPLMTKQYLDSLNKLVSEYLWNGGRAKIPHRILVGNREDGGGGLIDFETRDKALKASWVVKIQSNKEIANLAYLDIDSEMGEDIWKVNLSPKDARKIFPRITFWTDVLKSWCEINFHIPSDAKEVKSQVLWFNSNIRQSSSPLQPKSLFRLGIMRVRDLLDQENNFLPYQKMVDKVGRVFPFTDLYSIQSAIQKKWKSLLKQDTSNEQSQTLIENLRSQKNVTKFLYRSLKADTNLLKDHVQRWNNDDQAFLHLTAEELALKICKIRKITNVTKLRSFQYRFSLKAIITNCHLFRYGIKQDNLCTFCKTEPETLKHLFFLCPEVTPIVEWVSKITKAKIDWYDWVFCCIEKNPSRSENTLILLAKQFIYGTRCKDEKLNVKKLELMTRNFIQIEKYIAINNGRQDTHRIKWEHINESL